MGVMEARRRILLNQPHLIDASGNPISFQTDMAAKMGVKAYFSPVQSGSGDPSPSNVRPISGWTGLTAYRTGANLLRLSDATKVYCTVPTSMTITYASENTVTLTSTYNFTNRVIWEVFQVTENMVGQKISAISGMGCQLVESNDAWSTHSDISQPYTITDSDVGKRIGYRCYTYGQTTNTFADLSVNFGETLLPFEPYSGAEYPVTFQAVGKNLITGTGYAGELYNGASSDLKKTSERAIYTESANTITITCSVGWYGCLFATDVLPAGSYKVHAETASTTMRATVYVTDENLIYTSIVNNYSASFAPTVTLTTPARIAVFIGNTASGSFNVTNLQVESGTSYTAWEPFTNTLYGGYVDYERGEVVATHKTLTITGNESRTYYVYGNGLYNDGSILSDSKNGSSLYGRCSVQTNASSGLIDSSALVKASAIKGIQFNNVTTKWGLSEVSSNALIAKLQEWNAAGTPLQICYELATPIHYPITPTLIKSLKGANTIWSDMNGNLEISYWKH